MRQKHTIFWILAAVLFISMQSSIYIVGEWQQAIITQFGKIVGKPVTEAGLHFKLPFVQDVRYFEKRMLNWDGEPAQVPTRDKKFIFVDTTARWRIDDPVKFLQTVQSERQALQRISSIIDGKTKNIISNYKLVETVRNTNRILEKASEQSSDDEVEEKITGEIEAIEAGREKLSRIITEQARKEISSLGIHLIDVLIRRIAYEKSVEGKVFDRMISERNRIAEKIRSVGKGEVAKINGRRDLELKRIESEAYRQSKVIRGKAEAEAISIYAEAMNQDKDFYKFKRTLEAYEKTMPNRAKLILSTDSDFFKWLKKLP
jgi:membrane protease subunit HflC